MADSDNSPDHTAKVEFPSDNSPKSAPPETPTPLSPTLGKIAIALILAGSGLAVGAVMLTTPMREVAGIIIAGVGGLILSAGLGLGAVFIEPWVKQRAGVPAGERGETDLLAKLGEELRRPFFRWREIFFFVCLTVPPIIVAWLLKTPLPLVGLAFPAVLVSTVAVATFAKRYDALKRAFIWQLPATKRKQFLELLHKSDRQMRRVLPHK